MNRRTFLKSLTAACGAVVVCPGELLKSEPEWIKYARCFRSEAKICLDKLRAASSGRWPKYHTSYILNNKSMPFLVKEFETAFWSTKFKSPLMKRIK